jgi:hypothetical protein
MTYAVEIGFGVMAYIPSFIHIGLGDTHTDILTAR